MQGITTGEFAAYYIVWTLVRNMNIVFTPYGWEWRIREGELSAALLRPSTRSTTTSRLRRLEGGHDRPLAADRGVLWIAFDPRVDIRAAEIAAFCVAIWGAYLIRTMFLTSLGMVTFWTTRERALRARGRARAAPLRPARAAAR